MSTLISVIMPTHNSEKFISNAITSILNQTYTNFEFIIINDSSSDDSLNIIKNYQKTDSRIVLINNKTNKGVARCLNDGIITAKGDLIARMDADDYSFPTRLEDQVSYFHNNPNVDICGTYAKFFGKTEMIQKPLLSNKEIKTQLLFGCPMIHPTIMFKKKSIQKLNLQYNPEIKYAEDYNLWVESSTNLVFGNIPKILLKYRVHSSSVSQKKYLEQQKDAVNIQKKMYLKFCSNKDLIENNLQTINKNRFNRKPEELEKVAELFIECIKNNNQKKHIDPNYFENKLKKIFFNYCFYSSRYGSAAKSTWEQSKLSKNTKISLFKKIEFSIRCWLKIQK